MSGTLREMLCEAIGDSTRVDAALATFRTWLAENGLKVAPRESTTEMFKQGDAVCMAAYYAGRSAIADVVYGKMLAAAPAVDGLEEG